MSLCKTKPDIDLLLQTKAMIAFKNTKKVFWSVWRLPIVALLLSPFPVLCAVFFDTSSFIGYLIVLVLALLSIKPFRSSKINLLAALLLTAVILYCSIIFGSKEATNVWIMKIHLDPKFSLCAEKAIPIAGKGAINVCERRDYMNGESTFFIIYDSTDQIINTSFQCSKEWEKAARILHAPFANSGFDVSQLTGHYYQGYYSSASDIGQLCK